MIPVSKRPRRVRTSGARSSQGSTETLTGWRVAAFVGGCFAVGALWPAVTGIDFAPRPLGLNKRKPTFSLPKLLAPPPVAPESQPQISLSRVSPAFTEHETTEVQRTVVVGCGADSSCSDTKCDTPYLLAQLAEPLQQLARCKAAEGASGKLSLGLKLDFGRGHVTRVKAGKSTTLSKDKAEALIACAKTSVVGTPLRGIEHDHRYYWVYYLTEFIPPGSPLKIVEHPEASMIPTSGRATVGWGSAEVRNKPAEDSKLLVELQFGTRVQVTGRQGSWYFVKFGSPTRSGWVHEMALGL